MELLIGEGSMNDPDPARRPKRPHEAVQTFKWNKQLFDDRESVEKAKTRIVDTFAKTDDELRKFTSEYNDIKAMVLALERKEKVMTRCYPHTEREGGPFSYYDYYYFCLVRATTTTRAGVSRLKINLGKSTRFFFSVPRRVPPCSCSSLLTTFSSLILSVSFSLPFTFSRPVRSCPVLCCSCPVRANRA